MNLKFKDILGKILLVGITYYTHDEQYIEQKQFWGTVISANEQGVVVKQCSGELLPLPPDLSSTEKAALGEYTLRTTGEVVVNPDYLATWSL